MQYTSGTTGRPKAVERALPTFSPEQWVELFSSNMTRYDIHPGGDAVHLVTSPMYHLAPLSFGFFALNFEHTVVLMDHWDAEEALRLIERHRVTYVQMVPTQMHRLMQLPEPVRARYDTSSLRQLTHAAAPCPVDLKLRLFDWLGPVIYEFYGATEGGGTMARPEDWLAHPGTVGSAVGRARDVKILDDDGNELPPGTIGTVYMKLMGRLRLQGRRRQDRGQPARRLLHGRRRRRDRRGRVPLPPRPQDRHDHLGRRQHLSRRGRGRAAVPPGRGRCRRVRHPPRGLG